MGLQKIRILVDRHAEKTTLRTFKKVTVTLRENVLKAIPFRFWQRIGLGFMF